MRNLKVIAFVTLALVLAGSLAYWIAQPWSYQIIQRAACRDTKTDYVNIAPTQVKEFRNCAARKAKLFYERDYAESKDLAKAFLTLLSGILVASITFSEKIVDVHKATKVPLCAMVTCWLFLLCAIALTGGGLAWMAWAAGIASYVPELDIVPITAFASRLLMFAGLSFGAALVALIIAGVVSLMDKRTAIA
ncbi:MAG: hypothetical protein QFF03_03505 [Pseudomonadota bacterium]|nr:hypothetical protein [Pseudomonadota bacterium]